MGQALIIVYTGNGKGKTSASVGQAIRALGHGFDVLFVQFMKGEDKAAEQTMLRSLLNDNFYVGGLGFFRDEKERPKHVHAAIQTLQMVMQRLEYLAPAEHKESRSLHMIVLDEILYALHAQLLTQDEVETLLDAAQKKGVHVVLSGRYAPEWLIAKAHLVTELQEIKHPWKQGIKAQKGIEF